MELLNKHVDKYMESVLEHKRLHCRELVPTDRLACVRAFTRLFDRCALRSPLLMHGPECARTRRNRPM